MWLTDVVLSLRSFTRVGTMVFLLHDINDIFLEVHCSDITEPLLRPICRALIFSLNRACQ